MCIMTCTYLNLLSLYLIPVGIIGLLAVGYYYTSAGKKLKERKNLLTLLGVVFAILILCGVYFATPPQGCDIGMLARCKYLGICPEC